MTAFLPPFRVTNAAGVVVSGAKLYAYEAGTTTPRAVYTTADLTTAHPNPVVANSSGLMPAIFFAEDNYKLNLTDADGIALWSSALDNLNFSATSSGGGGSTTDAYEASVPDVSDLLVRTGRSDGEGVTAVGVTAAGDGGGGLFYWAAASTATHDGVRIVKPTAIDSADPGRWIRTNDALITPQMFGAKADGTTDDEIAIEAAIQIVKAAGGVLYWPAGVYVVTNNVADLWDVPHAGPGAIKRGSTTLHITPTRTETNQLYVNSATGSNDNDGLTSAYPFATLAHAENVVDDFATVTPGIWTINLAAGTYAKMATPSHSFMEGDLTIAGPAVAQGVGVETVLVLKTMSGNFTTGSPGETITGGTSSATATVTSQAETSVGETWIKVAGTSAAGFSVGETITGGSSSVTAVVESIHVIPTAIIDDGGTTSDTGVSVRLGQRVYLEDIKITGFTTGNAVTNTGGRLAYTNLHIENCQTGISTINAGVTTIGTGFFDGKNLAGSVGMKGLFNSIHACDATDYDEATYIYDFKRGILSDEGDQGHRDYVRISDCADSGLNIKRGAGAFNTDAMKINRCGVGVLAENNSWFNNSIIFGTGSNANTVNVRALNSPELSYLTTDNAARTLRVVEVTNVSAHTGTTSPTEVYNSPVVPDWAVSERGGISRIRAFGTCSLAGTATLAFNLDDGTTVDAIENVSMTSGMTEFYFEAEVFYSAATTQRGQIRLIANGNANDCDYGTGALTLTNKEHTLQIVITLANVGDSVTLSTVIFETTMGG